MTDLNMLVYPKTIICSTWLIISKKLDWSLCHKVADIIMSIALLFLVSHKQNDSSILFTFHMTLLLHASILKHSQCFQMWTLIIIFCSYFPNPCWPRSHCIIFNLLIPYWLIFHVWTLWNIIIIQYIKTWNYMV
jgi:hypothetical protein